MEYLFETDCMLINECNSGIQHHVCKICGCDGDFQSWQGIEMFVGLRENFDYFICPSCNTLQINEFPENIGKYYTHDYYSYQPPEIKPMPSDTIKDTKMILDVGCGAGTWLCNMASIGFVNLYGCDPFIQKDITYINGVKIKKRTIHEMEGKYDFIRFNDSFEHMPDPKNVFNSLNRLLKQKKTFGGEPPKIEISLPIYPNISFDIYGPYWYQMDAPRHFFLYSVKCITQLAEKHGFHVYNLKYTGDNGMFIYSKMYQMGIPFIEIHRRWYGNDPALAELRKHLTEFDKMAAKANEEKNADHATFTLIRSEHR